MRVGTKRALAFGLIMLWCVGVMPISAAVSPKKQAKIKQLRQKKAVKGAKIRAIEHKIHLAKVEKRTVIGQLTITESKLSDAQERLTGNKIRLLNAETDLRTTLVRLERTRKQLARRKDLLSQRIVDMYEGEDVNYVNVILGASDMWTFLTRTYYLKRILDSDTRLIDQIKEDEKTIEALRARQLERVSQIKGLQARLLVERNEVSGLVEERRKQLWATENKIDLYEKAQAELEAESRRIESEIQRMQSTPLGKAWSNRVFKGGLMMPVRGRLTSRFGYRRHPITGVHKLHTGVDIGCRTGTPIHAAADGIVIIAGRQGAYGLAVVIDHGGRVSTLYGHNSRLAVRRGQRVSKGQVIAYAGSTGLSTGPHCHFEKRINGSPVNPL